MNLSYLNGCNESTSFHFNAFFLILSTIISNYYTKLPSITHHQHNTTLNDMVFVWNTWSDDITNNSLIPQLKKIQQFWCWNECWNIYHHYDQILFTFVGDIKSMLIFSWSKMVQNYKPNPIFFYWGEFSEK